MTDLPKLQRYLVAYSEPSGIDDDRWSGYVAWAKSPADAVASRRLTKETIHVFELGEEGLTFRATRDYVLEPKTYDQPEPPDPEPPKGIVSVAEVYRRSSTLGEDGAEVLGL